MTTTNDIAERATAAILEDPAEARRLIKRTIEDALPLIVKAEWDSDWGPDFAAETIDRIRLHYAPTADDLDVIADEYMLSYDEIDDQLKDEDDPLDVWLKFSDYEDAEEAEYEANTFRNNDGTYRVGWYHTDVGIVTSETFSTYDEAKRWYEENGFSDFTV